MICSWSESGRGLNLANSVRSTVVNHTTRNKPLPKVSWPLLHYIIHRLRVINTTSRLTLRWPVDGMICRRKCIVVDRCPACGWDLALVRRWKRRKDVECSARESDRRLTNPRPRLPGTQPRSHAETQPRRNAETWYVVAAQIAQIGQGWPTGQPCQGQQDVMAGLTEGSSGWNGGMVGLEGKSTWKKVVGSCCG